jgi:2-polyprenyl-3-methyl-5-hydroxy-6-metoxy-1,4-benzoquinol methylase
MVGTTDNEYQYSHAGSTWSDNYLWPALEREVRPFRQIGVTRIFDLGCGNGRIAGLLDKAGFDVVAIDISKNGI